jgi:hypothetical protein
MYLQNAETRILPVQSSTSGMASWNTLPLEIRDQILSLFCRKIITEYKVFDKKKGVLEVHWQNLSWPTQTPQALIDFSSALRVSRSFRDSILRVKTDGQNPIKTLQRAQKSRCKSVLRNADKLEPDDWSSRRGFVNGAIFMKFAGLFWKNPVIKKDTELMWRILSVLRMRDLMMLIPHLERWVLKYSSRVPEKERCDYVVRSHFLEEDRDIVFESDYWKGPSGSAGDVVGITGLYHGWKYQAGKEKRELSEKVYTHRQNEANAQLFEVCGDVLKYLEEKGRNWWLFTLRYGQSTSWVIVDYELKSIWGTMCEVEVMCEWGDVWDWATWKFGGGDLHGKTWILDDYDGYDEPVCSDEDSAENSYDSEQMLTEEGLRREWAQLCAMVVARQYYQIL